MSSQIIKIANVKFHGDTPTKLTFADIFTWVIWQFPRHNSSGLCGAVHPPIAEHGWLPANIDPQKEVVQVHAHLGSTFETPEEAADYLNQKRP